MLADHTEEEIFGWALKTMGGILTGRVGEGFAGGSMPTCGGTETSMCV